MLESPRVLALVRDLIFSSKIISTARAVGAPVKIIRNPEQLPAEGKKLFVDLNQDGTLKAATDWKAATGGEVIGFVSHVDGPIIKEAREAGLDRVLSRGEFDRRLTEMF